VISFGRLGESEDPPFTFKVMVIRTYWPGASAREIEQQVTDRIEKKLQEAPYLDYIRSYSKPGESLVYFVAKDSTPPSEMPNAFYQREKKSAIFVRLSLRPSRAHSSMTNLVTPTAICMRSLVRGSATRN